MSVGKGGGGAGYGSLKWLLLKSAFDQKQVRSYAYMYVAILRAVNLVMAFVLKNQAYGYLFQVY